MARREIARREKLRHQKRVSAGEQEFSVFITNIPEMLDQYGLKGIFRKAGMVSDAYIPQKKLDRSRQRYGFVRFRSWQEAKESVKMRNNTLIRGCRIRVTMAKYEKGGTRRRANRELRENRQIAHQGSRIWRKKERLIEGVEGVRLIRGEVARQRRPSLSDLKGEDLKELKGEVNMEFHAWLSRSLVCTSAEPRDLASLSSAIISGYGQCTKICALSGFNFILTFQSTEEMEEALMNHEELDFWFYEIKRWDRYACSTTRKVWLEVFGVPPLGWKWENFKRIADNWGHLISLGKSIAKTNTFDSMRMLLETDILVRIDDEFILKIEDFGFRVFVMLAISFRNLNILTTNKKRTLHRMKTFRGLKTLKQAGTQK